MDRRAVLPHAAGGICGSAGTSGSDTGVRIITSRHGEEGVDRAILHSAHRATRRSSSTTTRTSASGRSILPGRDDRARASRSVPAPSSRATSRTVRRGGRRSRARPSPPPVDRDGGLPGDRDVTIVIPTRERADYLRASLHSVLASAAEAALVGDRTRVLVVDDASPTTRPGAVAAELGVAYHRIETHDGRNNPATAIAVGVGLVRVRRTIALRRRRHHAAAVHRRPRRGPRIGLRLSARPPSCARTPACARPARSSCPSPPSATCSRAGSTINDGAMTRSSLVRGLAWDPDLEQVIFYPIWLELAVRGSPLHAAHGAHVPVSTPRGERVRSARCR